MAERFLYIFLDEAGNLDFSPSSGSRYFVLGGITKERPFHAYKELTELKYDLVERGTALEYFHASENAQAVRNKVFDIIERNLACVWFDSIINEKQKVDPGLRSDEDFYPKVLGLLRAILAQHPLADFKEVVVFTDSLPMQRKRTAIEKGVKTTLAAMLPTAVHYRVLHHASKSNLDLQIADYCTWAIYRKWASQDARSFERIRAAVRSEWDVLHAEAGFPT